MSSLIERQAKAKLSQNPGINADTAWNDLLTILAIASILLVLLFAGAVLVGLFT